MRDPAGRRREPEADWYVCALPVHRIGALLDRGRAEADVELKNVTGLHTDWMVGMQFYLAQPVPVTHGHVLFLDSPWALTSISQAQFWDCDVPSTYGDGTVADCLSVDISSWDTPASCTSSQPVSAAGRRSQPRSGRSCATGSTELVEPACTRGCCTPGSWIRRCGTWTSRGRPSTTSHS
ncbi:hypothetical protein [Streptomyces sp. DSM 118878]